MSTSIDNVTISNTDNSLNTYHNTIWDTWQAMTDNSNDIDSKHNVSLTTENNISDFLENLTIDKMTETDIEQIDDSYNLFYSDLQYSNELNKELNKLAIQYENNEARITNSKKTKTYYFLMAWVLVLIFVVMSVFFSIIEGKHEINIFSKILLFLLTLVIFYHITKNLGVYIERNIQ